MKLIIRITPNSLRNILLYLLFFSSFTSLLAQGPCDPDEEPPILEIGNCPAFTLEPGQDTYQLFPSYLDEGSWDECDDSVTLKLGMSGDVAPNEPYLELPVGDHDILVSATDDAGNVSVLYWCVVRILAAKCLEDSVAPVALALPDRQYTLRVNNQHKVRPSDIDSASFDECESDFELYLHLSSGTEEITNPREHKELILEGAGIFLVDLIAIDENDRWTTSTCTVTLTAQNCQEDMEAPIAVSRSFVVLDLGGEESASITAQEFDAGSWDPCSEVTVAIRIDGSPFVFRDKMSFTSGRYPIEVQVTDASGNTSSAFSKLEVIEVSQSNCDFDEFPPVLQARIDLPALVIQAGEEVCVEDVKEFFYQDDNCTEWYDLHFELSTNGQAATECLVDPIDLVLKATDESGNSTTEVVPFIYEDCSGFLDIQPPTILSAFQKDTEAGLEGAPDMIEFGVSAFDNCTENEELIIRVTDRLDQGANVPDETRVAFFPDECKEILVYAIDLAGNFRYVQIEYCHDLSGAARLETRINAISSQELHGEAILVGDKSLAARWYKVETDESKVSYAWGENAIFHREDVGTYEIVHVYDKGDGLESISNIIEVDLNDFFAYDQTGSIETTSVELVEQSSDFILRQDAQTFTLAANGYIDGPVHARVFDLQGRLVAEDMRRETSSRNYSWEIPEIHTNGMYFVQVKQCQSGAFSTIRFVKS